MWDGCRGLRGSEKEQNNLQTVAWNGVGRVGTRKIYSATLFCKLTPQIAYFIKTSIF